MHIHVGTHFQKGNQSGVKNSCNIGSLWTNQSITHNIRIRVTAHNSEIPSESGEWGRVNNNPGEISDNTWKIIWRLQGVDSLGFWYFIFSFMPNCTNNLGIFVLESCRSFSAQIKVFNHLIWQPISPHIKFFPIKDFFSLVIFLLRVKSKIVTRANSFFWRLIIGMKQISKTSWQRWQQWHWRDLRSRFS